MRYISRSGYETYTACERRYYYEQLWQGTGLDKPIKEEYLTIGLALHTGMEHLGKKLLAEEKCDPEFDLRDRIMAHTGDALQAIERDWQVNMAGAYDIANGVGELPADLQLRGQLDEWVHLAQAMFLAWVRVRALDFFTQYEPLMVEEEAPLVLTSGLTLDTRSDLVVRDRQTGNVFVFNWKTTGSKSNFFEAHNRSIQMWTEALAVQHKLGEPVAGTICEGFFKGSKKRGSYSSVLLWGYERNEIWSAKYTSGWNKTAMWRKGYELPNGDWGLAAWINWIPTRLIEEQFMRTPPIPINEGAVEGWLPQVVQRETDLQHMLEQESEKDRLQYFFQRFGKQCIWCPYDSICQGLTLPEDLVQSGLLVTRKDHHNRGEENDG